MIFTHYCQLQAIKDDIVIDSVDFVPSSDLSNFQESCNERLQMIGKSYKALYAMQATMKDLPAFDQLDGLRLVYFSDFIITDNVKLMISKGLIIGMIKPVEFEKVANDLKLDHFSN